MFKHVTTVWKLVLRQPLALYPGMSNFQKVIKLLPLLAALVIVFTLMNQSSTRVNPLYTGTILAFDEQGTRISIKEYSLN